MNFCGGYCQAPSLQSSVKSAESAVYLLSSAFGINRRLRDQDDDNHDHHGHDHEPGTGEYIRLGLMSIIVVASLTGWWRPFMDRDWLAFAGTDPPTHFPSALGRGFVGEYFIHWQVLSIKDGTCYEPAHTAARRSHFSSGIPD